MIALTNIAVSAALGWLIVTTFVRTEIDITILTVVATVLGCAGHMALGRLEKVRPSARAATQAIRERAGGIGILTFAAVLI